MRYAVPGSVAALRFGWAGLAAERLEGEVGKETISFDGEILAGRYKLGPLLGKGGQASTHLALDIDTAERVAIKMFDLSNVGDWKQFELFERECRVLQDLDHPGIPRYLDEIRDEDDGRFYLVMELVPGDSLKDDLRRHGLMLEEQLWEVIFQVVEVLAYLHQRVPPIVHRDIKPGNLIRRPDGSIVVVDFGGVRDVLRPDGGSTVVGTFGYMAPEQLHGQAVPATDLFGLGATLCYLGTGIEPEKLPRKGLRIDFSKHLAVSKELSQLLRRLTEPDPDKRPESAVALLEELESGRFSIEVGDEPDVEPPAPPPVPQTDRDLPAVPPSTPWPLAIVIGAAMAFIGLAGRVGLAVAEYAIIPLIFAILVAASDKNAQENLRERERDIKRTVRGGRDFMKRLSRHGFNEVRRSRRWSQSGERRARRDDPDSARRMAELREHQRRVKAQQRHRQRHSGTSSRSRRSRPRAQQRGRRNR